MVSFTDTSINHPCRCLPSVAGTDNGSMYPLIAAIHALKNGTTKVEYLGDCQASNYLNEDLTDGKILICSYSIRFILGLSSIKQALETAKNVSAIGVIFYMDPFISGFRLNPTPMNMPGVVIPSADDSKVSIQIQEY